MRRVEAVNAAATAKMWAALRDDFDAGKFNDALREGADVRVRDADGRTVLHALAGIEPVVESFANVTPAGAARRVLLVDDADVNALCSKLFGATPLHLAAKLEEPREMMAALLAGGADVRAVDDERATPLFWSRTAASVSMLLAHGADPAVRDVDQRVAAHEMAGQLRCDAVAELLRHPGAAATVHAADAVRMTPLHVLAAATHEHDRLSDAAACVAVLLQHGADGSAEDIYGTTPIDYAMDRLTRFAEARLRAVQLGAAAPAMMFNYNGGYIRPTQQGIALRHCLAMLRALWWHRRRHALAAYARHRKGTGAHELPASALAAVLQPVVTDAAPALAAGRSSFSQPAGRLAAQARPLGIAAETNAAAASCCQSTRLRPALKRRATNADATAAMWRAATGSVDGLALANAVEAGADVAAFNADGATILHVLCMKETAAGELAHNGAAAALRRILMFEGVNVNMQHRDVGLTPLHEAAFLMQPAAAMKALLAHGADVHAGGIAGRSPLHYVRTASAVSALLAAGADPMLRDFDESTPAHRAVWNLILAALAEMLRLGDAAAMVHAADAAGMTPLHIAAHAPYGHSRLDDASDTARMLLRHGADGSVEDIYGKTPLDYAMQRFEAVAAVRPRLVQRAGGEGVMMYRYPKPAVDITPVQQAAALRHCRAMLRELWWHRRRPALAAFARARAGATAAAA